MNAGEYISQEVVELTRLRQLRNEDLQKKLAEQEQANMNVAAAKVLVMDANARLQFKERQLRNLQEGKDLMDGLTGEANDDGAIQDR